jgi:hypothetical protein
MAAAPRDKPFLACLANYSRSLGRHHVYNSNQCFAQLANSNCPSPNQRPRVMGSELNLSICSYNMCWLATMGSDIYSALVWY